MMKYCAALLVIIACAFAKPQALIGAPLASAPFAYTSPIVQTGHSSHGSYVEHSAAPFAVAAPLAEPVAFAAPLARYSAYSTSVVNPLAAQYDYSALSPYATYAAGAPVVF